MVKGVIRNYRWRIVALLFTATTINYLDRQIIGLLKPLLEVEFHWSETDYAHIIMAFTAAYAIGLISFGWLIDKLGTKIGYALTISIWSVASMCHALVRSAFGFGVARVWLGLGESGNFPAAMKAVAEWFPKKERALATGIFNSGTSVGVVLSLLIVPLILRFYGWQEVFWITGSFGFLWLIFWWTGYALPAKKKRLSREELTLITEGQEPAHAEGPKPRIRWIKLFAFRQTWAVVVGKAFIDPIFWFFLFWLPSYFFEAFGLDLTKPSLGLMIIYTATTVGSIGGGWVSSRMIRSGWETLKARKVTLLICAILEISIILTEFAMGIWMAVLLLSIAVAAHQAWATNVFTLSSDLFPPQVVSSVVGISGMAGAVGGILFPILVGYLLDSYKAAGNLTGGYNVLFTVCGFTYLSVLLIIHLLTRNPKPVDVSELTSTP
jgi:ACS family hexuronate transporter-like MFS transporter